MVALLCVFNLAGFVFIDPNSGDVGMEIFAHTVIILVSFIVIWRFWFGSRLSRILVLITSAVAILNLFFLASVGIAQKAIIIGEALLAVLLFYWLFTTEVRLHFAAGPKK